MKTLLSILLLTTSAVFGQGGGITVHLHDSTSIRTSYVYITNSALSTPHVRIDSRNGRKLTVDEVAYIEGIDQRKEFRHFRPITVNGSKLWAERTFKSDRMEIVYTPSGEWGGRYKSKFFRYSKDGGEFKNLSYRHLKRDLSDCPASVAYLKKGVGIRTVQYLLYAGGATMVIAGAVGDLNNKDDSASNPEEENGLPVPPLFIAGAVCLYVPWLMHGAKMKNFEKAAQAYK